MLNRNIFKLKLKVDKFMNWFKNTRNNWVNNATFDVPRFSSENPNKKYGRRVRHLLLNKNNNIASQCGEANSFNRYR